MVLVTRATREQDMGPAVRKQVFGQKRALIVAALLMGLVGIVPGMPNLPFLVLAAVIGYAAWQMHQRRSEEHTSELQSLMRISYAVFCLKKKNITNYQIFTS